MTNLYTKTTFKIKPRSLLTCSFLFFFPFFFFCLYLLLHCFFFLLLNVCRVPGNSAAVTALQEELNNRGIENVCLEEEVMGRSFHPYKFLRVEQLFTWETTKKKKKLIYNVGAIPFKTTTRAIKIKNKTSRLGCNGWSHMRIMTRTELDKRFLVRFRMKDFQFLYCLLCIEMCLSLYWISFELVFSSQSECF